MNRAEFVLGVSVFVLTILSVGLFNYGVVSSERYPEQYTYGSAADFSVGLLFLIMLEGLIATFHGARSKGFAEAGLGIATTVWGFLAFLLVSVSLSDGRAPYIIAFPTPVTMTELLIFPGVFLGIVLLLDGLRRHEAMDQT